MLHFDLASVFIGDPNNLVVYIAYIKAIFLGFHGLQSSDYKNTLFKLKEEIRRTINCIMI